MIEPHAGRRGIESQKGSKLRRDGIGVNVSFLF